MNTPPHPPGFRSYDFGSLAADLMKPRPDAKLKTLPEPRQAQIADFARTHSLAQTVQWLAGQQFKTSSSAVSQFLRWYRIQQDMARNETALQNKLVDFVRKDPTQRLDTLGHLLFGLSAIKTQDPLAWYRCQTIALCKSALR